MNIFRSKEVYKRIPKVSSEENPLRPVRGMWVSGEYRPPYCIDETIHILDMSSSSAEVRVYTDRIQHVNDWEGVEYTNLYYPQIGFDVIQYSTSSFTLSDDTTVEYIGIYSSEYDILHYSQASYTFPDETIVEYIDIPTMIGFEILNFKLPIYWGTNPDPMVNIVGFGSDDELIVE